MSLSKQTDYGTGHDFEEFIEELLNQNGIHANVVSYKQGDNGIDIIATFNRQIILIQCKNTGKPIDANIIKNFQASVYRFGEPILSIIVYNSEKLKNYNCPLTKSARLWWKAVCPEIQIASEKMIVTCIQKILQKKSHSVKPTCYKSDDDFKFQIENLLSGNRILVNSFNSRKDKIDIIATFNRQIILIHLSNSSDVNTFKGLQTSVYRFGEGILSIIVQNSENFNNPSIKNERSYRKIKIITEKKIVNYIKNSLTKKNFKKTSHKKYGLSANAIERRDNDVWSCSKQISDKVSWICPECTYINNPLMLDCEMCATARTAKNNFIEEINTINQLENQDYISTARPAKNRFIEEINTMNQLVNQDYSFLEPMVAKISKNKNLCLEQWDCPDCTLINESDVVMCIACGYIKDNSIK
ncbi:11640_t:CDS:2 [Gigaspora rosea]|nr:11640_t:CDS:2 [Gigaspora rosea]